MSWRDVRKGLRGGRVQFTYKGEEYNERWPRLWTAIINRETAAGRLLLPNWEDRVMEEALKVYPNGFVKEPHSKKRLNVGTIVSFAYFIAKWWNSKELVSEEEMNRRAKICEECPMRMSASGCAMCLSTAERMFSKVHVPSKHDFKKERYCGICGCLLPFKLWIPKKFLWKMGAFYPDICWMTQEETE